MRAFSPGAALKCEVVHKKSVMRERRFLYARYDRFLVVHTLEKCARVERPKERIVEVSEDRSKTPISVLDNSSQLYPHECREARYVCIYMLSGSLRDFRSQMHN